MTEEIRFRRYTCDICKKVYETEKDSDQYPLTALVLPTDLYTEHGKFMYNKTSTVEVCEVCLKDIIEILSAHYEMKTIRYSGLSIEKKGGGSDA